MKDVAEETWDKVEDKIEDLKGESADSTAATSSGDDAEASEKPEPPATETPAAAESTSGDEATEPES